MKFEEVLPALREGKKIRLKGCKEFEYLFKPKNENELRAEDYRHINLSWEDLLADDWEIVKSGPKKIKLRDLTEEEWGKRKEKYCADMSCSKCMFDIVNCSARGWIIHKDLHSNKFLDQEVEIEED